MVTKNPVAPAEPAPSEDRHVPGDPIPVGDATEADSDSTWALFSGVVQVPSPKPAPQPELEPEFAKTLRSSL